jgi:ketosteroid isomerase-like protein
MLRNAIHTIRGANFMGNAAKVQAFYEAFGKGDVPTILAGLADDVDWEYAAGETAVPWLQRRHGRDAVGGFFEALGGLEFHKFQPTAIIEGDGVVVALIDIEATVKATGKRIAEEDELHLWRFNADGKVARFRHGVNTHAHELAIKG